LLNYQNIEKKFKKLLPFKLIEIFGLYDKNQKPLSSAIVFKSPIISPNPYCYYSAGASSDFAKKTNIPGLLIWAIIRKLREEKYNYFDLGGLDLDNLHNGPSHFKRGFSDDLIYGISGFRLFGFPKSLYYLINFFRD